MEDQRKGVKQRIATIATLKAGRDHRF